MPYRAMALVAASLLFATQSHSQTTQSDRMGAGGGGKGAVGVTTVNSSKSNSSDRMGAGGGGKGAVQRPAMVGGGIGQGRVAGSQLSGHPDTIRNIPGGGRDNPRGGRDTDNPRGGR
jgi:hypothetical protein